MYCYDFLALIVQACSLLVGITGDYNTALSHKDWELPNSQIWLAELNIESGLDFPVT